MQKWGPESSPQNAHEKGTVVCAYHVLTTSGLWKQEPGECSQVNLPLLGEFRHTIDCLTKNE